MTIKIGDKAPDFELPSDGGGNIELKDFEGKKLLLYFYPKDSTPGCTKQAKALRDAKDILEAKNVAVLGMSKDSVKRHDNFIAKYELNFPLASDIDGDILEKYGVWVEKNTFGRKYMGIERTSYLIDEKGIIRHVWRKVKVKNHLDDVLKALEEE